MNDFHGEPETQTRPTDARQTKRQQTIFYVDDNPRALRLLTSVLQGCGHGIIAAGTATEALASMEHSSFDLALLAYRLPRLIGFKLAHDIKQRLPGTPVILISGYALWNPEELSNVDVYVGKGSTFDRLLSNIRMLIGRGGKHRIPFSEGYPASGVSHSVVNAL
jgi:CheY-like chemotaxis protein